MDIANKVKSHLNDEVKNLNNDVKNHINDGVRSFDNEVKNHLNDVDSALVDHGFKAHAREGYEGIKDGLETAREAVVDVGRKLNWKAVLGITAGVAVIVGMVVVTRRRRRGNLIERGIHEGTRYAMMVPEGWNKAQHHAMNVAQESARESVRLWKKIPRIHVELK